MIDGAAAAAIGELGPGGGEAAAVVLGAAMAVAVGLAALAPRPARRALAAVPLAGALGLALLTPALYALWRLGLPAAPATVLGTAALLAGGFALLRRLRGRRGLSIAGRAAQPEAAADATLSEPTASGPAPTRPPTRPRWLAAAWLPAAAALAVVAGKLARVPLWSWDHYAIWGLKARRLFPGGGLDLAWLVPGEHARPDYPVGLPLAWRALTLGAEPGPAAFVCAHLLMAVALVALVGAAGRRLAGRGLAGRGLAARWSVESTLAGAAAAALVAASPLVWDTESLGLADLPLALWAVAAVAVVVGWIEPASAPAVDGEPTATGAAATALAVGGPSGIADRPGPEPAAPIWAAGVCLGFLPWLKSEGLPLAVLLLAALALALYVARERHPLSARSLIPLAAPALALGAAGVAATPVGGREIGFFRGDWAGRGLARLGDLPELLRALAGDLFEPGWLGLWPLWVAAMACALVVLLRTRRRRGRRGDARTAAVALALSAAVAAQLALYAATYLVSYIPTLQHAETSFYRVAAALAPLALLASAAALGAVGTGVASGPDPPSPGGGSSAPGRRR